MSVYKLKMVNFGHQWGISKQCTRMFLLGKQLEVEERFQRLPLFCKAFVKPAVKAK
jgi:hypothetical protein